LPKYKNQTSVKNVQSLSQLHDGVELKIYELLARKADDEQAAKYLQLAIQKSPGSLHLYDLLVRIYRKQRRYDEIHKLLDNAVLDTREKLKTRGLSDKRRGSLRRRLSAFEVRVASAKNRAMAKNA
jgi:hypothetical protein